MAVTSRPATRTVPRVGASSPPTMFSSVVLPQPDRPRTTTTCPRATVNETPRSACTAVAPCPKVRATSDTVTRGGSAAGEPAISVLPGLRRRGRVRVAGRRGRLVWPHADVVGPLLEPDPVVHAEPADHLAGQLHASGPVQHGVLHRDVRGLAAGVGRAAAKRLG